MLSKIEGVREVKFDVLRDSDKHEISKKFSDGDASKSRRIRFHDDTIWLLAPESRDFTAVLKAVAMIKNMAKPEELFLTLVPLSFIESAVA